MIIPVICNKNLLFIDKQYLNILKTKNQLKNSFIRFSRDGSACGYNELNDGKIKFASEMSLVLDIVDDSNKTILTKPLNIDRSIYYKDSGKFYTSQGVEQSPSLSLLLIQQTNNFERLLDLSFGYNTNTESYTIVMTFLERK